MMTESVVVPWLPLPLDVQSPGLRHCLIFCRKTNPVFTKPGGTPAMILLSI
jgi:hypothetical protein